MDAVETNENKSSHYNISITKRINNKEISIYLTIELYCFFFGIIIIIISSLLTMLARFFFLFFFNKLDLYVYNAMTFSKSNYTRINIRRVWSE